MCTHRAILFVHYAVEVVDDVGMAETFQYCSLFLKGRCFSTLLTNQCLDRHRRAMEAGFVDLHRHSSKSSCTAWLVVFRSRRQ